MITVVAMATPTVSKIYYNDKKQNIDAISMFFISLNESIIIAIMGTTIR